MANKYIKDAYDKRNGQQNNEIPINLGKKVRWYSRLVKVEGKKLPTD